MEVIREFFLSVALPAMGTVLLVALFSVAKQYAAKIKDERLRRLVEALVMAEMCIRDRDWTFPGFPRRGGTVARFGPSLVRWCL